MQMSRGRCGGCSQRITQLHQLFLRKPFTSTSPPPLPHSSSSSLFAPHPKSTLSSFLHSSPIFHPSAARIGAFRFFSSKSPNLGFNAKKVFDKPTAALTSAFSRYREAIVLQLEAFFKRNQLFLLGAAGVVFCALLWRILFGVANTFVVLSEGMAKYGFLALSSAIVAFTGLYIRSNPPQITHKKLRSKPTTVFLNIRLRLSRIKLSPLSSQVSNLRSTIPPSHGFQGCCNRRIAGTSRRALSFLHRPLRFNRFHRLYFRPFSYRTLFSPLSLFLKFASFSSILSVFFFLMHTGFSN